LGHRPHEVGMSGPKYVGHVLNLSYVEATYPNPPQTTRIRFNPLQSSPILSNPLQSSLILSKLHYLSYADPHGINCANVVSDRRSVYVA
jgi:hypothetical protein